MIGRVVSNKSKDTAVVIVESRKVHPLYKKSFARSKKFLVDDAFGVSMGDMVVIEKCKPISKMKHWKIVQVVGQNLEEITSDKLKAGAEKIIAEVMPEEKEGDRVQGIGSSEGIVENTEVKNKTKKQGKEKLAPKP